MDDVIKNEDDGGHRRIVRGNPAMRIDYIDNYLIVSMLLLLDMDYNLGLVYIYL
jgi:hypothetical protein